MLCRPALSFLDASANAEGNNHTIPINCTMLVPHVPVRTTNAHDRGCTIWPISFWLTRGRYSKELANNVAVQFLFSSLDNYLGHGIVRLVTVFGYLEK